MSYYKTKYVPLLFFLKTTVIKTLNVLQFNGNFHFVTQFLQMADVSLWNETITIHSNTPESR